MGSLANYGELRAALSEFIGHRNISAVLTRLVKAGESRLNREIRTREMIADATLTFTDGVASLPSDFLEVINLYGLNGYPYRAGQTADARRTGSMWSKYSIAGDTITINGYSGDRDMAYYAALPTLTASNTTTNWLLDRYSDVYLYAVGLEAAKHLQDNDIFQRADALFKDALQSLRVDNERATWSNSVVRVQGLTP